MLMFLRDLAKDIRCCWRRWRLGVLLPKKNLAAGRVLVLSPHPDDETFGCGNFIAMKRSAGVPVRVVFLTDGEASLKDHGHDLPAEVARVRREQSAEACRTLGVTGGEICRFGLPDGAVPRRGQAGFDELVERLMRESDAFQPAEILCPHPLDGHGDHTAAAEAAAEVIARSSAKGVRLIHYSVWLCYRPAKKIFGGLDCSRAWLLDGSAVHSQKLAAIKNYYEQGRFFNGIPYCGKLPFSLRYCGRQKNELYFDPAEDVR